VNVKRYFQQRADNFDRLYDEGDAWSRCFNRILRRGLYERVRLTLHELEEIRDFTVLDVGCGSGRNSVLFVKAGARRVVGVDFSERMIELAAEFSRKCGVASRCEFVKADFLANPVEEKFSAVVALGVFDYVADPPSFLRSMVERATERVIVSFPRRSLLRAPLRKLRYMLGNCPVHFYSLRQIDEMCRTAGLKQYRLVPYASSGVLLVGKIHA
jgi:SAM-dependent methyltransferase